MPGITTPLLHMKFREGSGQKRALLLAAASIAAIAFWIAGANAQQTAPGPFTDAQAGAGQAAYAQNCASCHANSLGGSGEAPALTGTGFIGSWGQHTTQELYNK